MHTATLALVLVLRTYDMAGLVVDDLAAAQRSARQVLRSARIDLLWVSCHPSDVPGLCGEVRGPSELLVRLLLAPANAGDDVLAAASVDTQAALGSLATIYVNRVRTLAASAGVEFGMLVGRVIAHEVGHLLLGSAHSETGLMRPAWSAAALRNQGAWAWQFNPGEAKRLRDKLTSLLQEEQIGRRPVAGTRAGHWLSPWTHARSQ